MEDSEPVRIQSRDVCVRVCGGEGSSSLCFGFLRVSGSVCMRGFMCFGVFQPLQVEFGLSFGDVRTVVEDS